MKKIESYKSVCLPHIRTTVHFLDLSKLKDVPITGSAYTIKMGDDPYKIDICVFIKNIKSSTKKIMWMPIIAHELVHVIQLICSEIQTNIQEEQEHMAYIMTYLMGELLGFSQENVPPTESDK